MADSLGQCINPHNSLSIKAPVQPGQICMKAAGSLSVEQSGQLFGTGNSPRQTSLEQGAGGLLSSQALAENLLRFSL